ncbi:MAG: DUF6504 family protein [Candidatus Nanopelagicales bacterium]
MSRRYADPVQVWTDDTGAPTRIRWRGRTYLVTDRLGYWVEAGSWWSAVTAAVVGRSLPDPGVGEWTVWRVEARRGVVTAALDLRCGATGWTVRAVAD